MGAAFGAILLLSASACGGNGAGPSQTEDPVPDLDRGTALAWQARPTVVQTLRLLNPGLRVGDTLKLESTLKNVGNMPVSIEHVVCELDLEGDLKTYSPLILCFAYSVRSTLAPGQEVSSRLERVINSEAGRYTIRVRHLLDPDVWVPAELTVHPR
jgi:hypothetical protein